MSVESGNKPIAVSETEAAKAIGMSVHWLRRDRRTDRLIPFYKFAGAVRYDLDRVREALASREEGGAGLKRRKAGTA